MQINHKQVNYLLLATQGIGAVFVAIFLAAYLGGLPSTNVLHSEPAFRIPLIIFGAILLVLILISIILAAYLRKNENSTNANFGNQNFYTPLRIGLLTVTIAYVLFNLHTMFTLEWIGEWARTPGSINTLQLIEDINAAIGNSFRMTGSIIAIAAVTYYFTKRGISANKSYLVVRVVLIFEAIYWLGLLASGISGIYRLFAFPRFASLTYTLGYVLPAILEATIVPIVLIVFAYTLSPNKPIKNQIRWGLIAGTAIVFDYWVLNSGIWILTLSAKGITYLITYPYMLISFLSTTVGLLLLALYSVYATKKLSGTQRLQDLNLKPIGTTVLGLGLFYLWNYLTWIFFGGSHVWSIWYEWLLGHNMDLWMLSLPLIGIPLLFFRYSRKK